MPLFDTHIVVDWSAATSPATGENSIWWAAAIGEGCVLEPRNPPTRYKVIESLAAFIADELDAGRRVLAGFDFPFGYPAGVAERLTGEASALAVWDWLAEHVQDEPSNGNNRFEVAARINGFWKGIGPFWGRPRQWSQFKNIPTKEKVRTCRPRERRIADKRATGAKTVWQLAYPGSVGSQVLVGLPALKRLLADPRIGGRGAVWPFDTGLQPPNTREAPLVLAEIYPSLLRKEVAACRGDGEVLDRAQVRVNAAAFARLDRQGGLAPLFGGAPGLGPNERRLIEQEEAWILGLGHEDGIRDAARTDCHEQG